MKQQKGARKEPNPVLAAWLESPGLLFEAPKQTPERLATAISSSAAAAAGTTAAAAGSPGLNSSSVPSHQDLASRSEPASAAAPHQAASAAHHAQPEATGSDRDLGTGSREPSREGGQQVQPAAQPREQASHARAGEANQPGPSLPCAPPRPAPPCPSIQDTQSQCMGAALHHYMELVQRESHKQKARDKQARAKTAQRLVWVRRGNRLAWAAAAVLAALYAQFEFGSLSLAQAQLRPSLPPLGVLLLLSAAVLVCGGAYLVERQMVAFVGAASGT